MFSLEYQQSMLVDDEEPSRLLKFIDGKVLAFTESDRKVRVGSFAVILIDIETAVNESESIFDVFDVSSKTIDYYGLYKSDLEFKPSVIKALGGYERWAPNMLILDRLEILPRFRGHGAGLRILRCLQLQFSAGCGLVVMKPFPLQFEGGTPEENKDEEEFIRMRLDQFSTTFEKALKGLQTYYGRLGFVKVPGTPYIVADPQMRVPGLAALGLDD